MLETIETVRVVMEFNEGEPRSKQSSGATLWAYDRSRPAPASTGAAYDIQRRDLRKTLRIFPVQRRYQEIPIFSLLSPQEVEAVTRSGRHWRASLHRVQPATPGGARISIHYEQTGDESILFDCLARRWRTVQREERPQGAGSSSSETITEAWYLDPVQTTERYPGFCPLLIRRGFCYMTLNNQAPLIETHGEAPAGLCAQSTSRTISRQRLPDGEYREERHERSSRISSVSCEVLARSLFEPPRGFRKMPVYPGRVDVARLNAARNWSRIATSLRRTIFGQTN